MPSSLLSLERKCCVRWEKPEITKEIMPSSLLSLKEMQHQMGEARTNQRNIAKPASVSGSEEVLDVYVIRSQADALVCRLLCLLSKEMQHQMGEARTIQRNNAKQSFVSGGNAMPDGEKPELTKEIMPSSLLSLEDMHRQMGEARTIQRNDAKQPSVSGGNATSDGRSQNHPKK
jgi:hypothetical protein